MASILDFANQKKNELLTKATQPPAPVTPKAVVSLAPESDTGVVGDSITGLSSVMLKVQNPTGFVWAETITSSASGNTPARFDPGVDILAFNGVLHVQLQPGINSFAVYQLQNGVVSEPSYVNVYLDPVQSAQYQMTLHKLAIAYLGRPLTPSEVQIGTTVVARAGGNPMPVVQYLSTSDEFLARYKGLLPDQALSEVYRFMFDRSPSFEEILYWYGRVAQGLPASYIPWEMTQQALGRDAATLSAKTLFAVEVTKLYDRMMEKMPGTLKSERILLETGRLLLDQVSDLETMRVAINSLEAVISSESNIVGSKTGALNGSTLSLAFDRPIHWQSLDKNADGFLSASLPGGQGELHIAIGGKKGFKLENTQLDWLIPTPAFGSQHLAISNVDWKDSDGGDDAILSVLVIGLPDLQDGIKNNVLFTGLS